MIIESELGDRDAEEAERVKATIKSRKMKTPALSDGDIGSVCGRPP